VGSNPAEAVGFLGQKNPQHAFLRRGSKAVGPMLEFRQNYYWTFFLPTVPPFAARIFRVIAAGGTWRLKWEGLKAGESNGKLPQELAQDAVCQSHTGHMTGLWFLPSLAFKAGY